MLLLVAIAVGGAIVCALSGTVEEWVVEELTILVSVLALAWLHPGRARFGDNPGLQPSDSNHISNIFTKLQLADSAQAIVAAREAGLGRGHSPE